ncbi:hypothetical protein IW136_002034 [Coemansia sp. RSA 678]|nr:hypothetical protein IW136_002034 [Coemansia sp. RSA 678]
MKFSIISTFILCTSVVLGAPTAHSGTDLWRRTDTAKDWDNVANHHLLPGYQLRSKNVDGVCDAGVTQMSGYLDTADDKHFFYWFFEAQNQTKGKDTPLVIWLNGGPGCSSLGGLLTALGPCLISDDGNSTTRNPYGWNQNANMLFIDQPTNVGFSYGTPVSNSTAAAEDFVALMQLFYTSYPQYASSELHVFGESYAGHYIPAIGSAIIDHNTQANHTELPLKSIGIGNGLYDAHNQYKYMSKMGCNSTYEPIFSQELCDQMDTDYGYCARMIDDCFSNSDANKCSTATMYCATAVVGMYTYEDPLTNPYDVRSKCEVPGDCYLKSANAAAFLNQTSVQQMLNAKETSFQTCSPDVQLTFMLDNDVIRSYIDQLARILDAGVPALIYNGDADWICNHYGVKSTLEEMKWNGQSAFNSAQDTLWLVNTKPAGEARTSGGLTFLKVYESGHMVPMDQPENSLDMLNRWLSNTSF